MIPAEALPHIPVFVQEAKVIWPAAPQPVIFGQVDHETACPRKKMCWNPRTQLKTDREQGVGLGQITRVFGRFDALAEMKKKYPRELSGWNWEETLYDSKYQVRASLLKNKENWKSANFATGMDQIYFGLTMYNRGVGGVLKERKLCSNTPGCNPNLWFGNVAETCLASKVKQPGYALSFCEISRKYAKDIVENRTPKYQVYYDRQKN